MVQEEGFYWIWDNYAGSWRHVIDLPRDIDDGGHGYTITCPSCGQKHWIGADYTTITCPIGGDSYYLNDSGEVILEEPIEKDEFPTSAPGVYRHGSNFTELLYTWDEIWGTSFSFENDYLEGSAATITGTIGGDIIIPNEQFSDPTGMLCTSLSLSCGNIVIPEYFNAESYIDLYDFKSENGRPDSEIDCNLKIIYIKTTTPPMFNTWGNVELPYLTKIVVPKGYGDIYKAATGWCDFGEIIVEGEIIEDDQNALAGAYTSGGTFSSRLYTWDEMVANGENGVQPYYTIEEDAPSDVVASGEDRVVYSLIHDIVVPDDVTNCGWFYTNGNNIVLPKTTTVVYGSDDYKMGTVYIKATTPPQLKGPAFYECTNAEPGAATFGGIVVPIGCGDAYKSATGWCDYAEYITEGEMPI